MLTGQQVVPGVIRYLSTTSGNSRSLGSELVIEMAYMRLSAGEEGGRKQYRSDTQQPATQSGPVTASSMTRRKRVTALATA